MFFVEGTRDHRELHVLTHSFPTRRSSDLIVLFRKGLTGLVLGGRYSDLPLLSVANVDKDDVRVDPVHGLFGLAVVEEKGFLGEPGNREALSMAIERERLPADFSMAGWPVTGAILPEQLEMTRPPDRKSVV